MKLRLDWWSWQRKESKTGTALDLCRSSAIPRSMNLLPPAHPSCKDNRNWGPWVTAGKSRPPGYRTKRKLGFLPAVSGKKTYLFDGSQWHLKPSLGFMAGCRSFCLFPKCSVAKWELSLWVKWFSGEDPITPRHRAVCCFKFPTEGYPMDFVRPANHTWLQRNKLKKRIQPFPSKTRVFSPLVSCEIWWKCSALVPGQGNTRCLAPWKKLWNWICVL